MKEEIKKLQDLVVKLFSNEEKSNDVKLSEIISKDGGKFFSPDETIAVGSEVFGIDENGNQIPLVGEVEILLEDGSVIEVMDGKIVSIEAKEEKPEDEPSEVEEKLESDSKDSDSERISSLEERVNELIEVTKKLGEFSSQLRDTLDEIKTIPSSNSIKLKVQPERELTKEESRINRLLAIKNNI